MDVFSYDERFINSPKFDPNRFRLDAENVKTNWNYQTRKSNSQVNKEDILEESTLDALSLLKELALRGICFQHANKDNGFLESAVLSGMIEVGRRPDLHGHWSE